jgi:hypothetical protein
MSVFQRFHKLTRRNPNAWLAIFVVAFVVAVGLNVLRAVQKLNILGQPDMQTWALQDFRDAVYYPIVAMWDGANPYDVESYFAAYPVGQMFPLYSPSTLLVHLPFALPPFPVAQWIYFASVAGGTFLLVRLALKYSSEPITPTLMFALAAVILVSKPGHVNLVVGQVALQVVLASYVALHYSRSRPWISAIGLAFTSLKPTYAVPLAILMLCRRDVRAVVWGAVLSVALALPTGLLILANTGWESFLAAIPGNITAFESDPNVAAESSWLRFDCYVIASRLSGGALGSLGTILAPLVVLATAAVALWKLGDSDHNRRADSLSGVIICLAVITSVHHQIYDGLMLVLPIVALLSERSRLSEGIPTSLRSTLALLMLVPVVNWLPKRLWIDFASNQTLWNLAASITGLSLLLALAICVVLATKSGPASNDAGQTASG